MKNAAPTDRFSVNNGENQDSRQLSVLIRTARGIMKAPLVFKNIQYLNVFTQEWLRSDIAVCEGHIAGIGTYSGDTEIDGSHLTCVPGFIDGHIHLESAMVTPPMFAQAVIPHGTTAVIADPHEIANVLGTAGIDYMLNATQNLPLDVFFMLPSCVPASPFDENGAALGFSELEAYLYHPMVLGLGEMMDFLGVLNASQGPLEKIAGTQACNKRVDGHAPSLSGLDLNAYIAAGIFTDHESVTADEALSKLRLGQWVMIREGSAAKNLNALSPLIKMPYAGRCLFVTDDKHPGSLMHLGHIDHMIKKVIALGTEPSLAYTMASFNAAQCFSLERMGALAPGYKADFVLLDDINTVSIHSVYKAGRCAFSRDTKAYSLQPDDGPALLGKVSIGNVDAASFQLKRAKVIGLVEDELLTTDEGWAECADPSNNLCKIAVIERHKGTGHIGKAYLRGYGLKKGAIASSIAHDAHNIIIAGISDTDMAIAANHVAAMGGGLAVVCDGQVLSSLALPIAGLMSTLPVKEAASALDTLMSTARYLGVADTIDPFMTLSFVSLPVIPALRLTTRGAFDVLTFALVNNE